MAKILIVGCGQLGYELGIKLTRNGHQVSGLKRNPPTNTNSQINFIRADIADALSLKDLPVDFDYLFFIVASGRRDESSYQAIYETGVANLLDHFERRQQTIPWFFVSSTSVYGQHGGEWVDENSETLPSQTASQYIVQAEQKVIRHDSHNIVVRFSGIYGPGREALLRMAQQGPEIQTSPPYYTNRIHQQDCLGILSFLLECRLKGVDLDQCYLASDDDPATMWDVVNWIAQESGSPPPKAKEPTPTADMNKRCNNLKIKQLGYKFIHPSYKSGYAELLRKN